MTENLLIKFLSDESERMGSEWIDDKVKYDTDICGWKDISGGTMNVQRSVPEPATFRIRVVDTKVNLKRSFSSKSQLSTLSSSNGSRSNSPKIEISKAPKKSTEDNGKNRRKLTNFNFYQAKEEIGGSVYAQPQNIGLNIKKPPMPRKQRKPIKIFKLGCEERNEE